MNKLILLLKTSRPLLWILGPVLFLVGASLSQASWNFLATVQLLLLTFPFCLFLYGINDVFDYKSDNINPRKGSHFGIKLNPNHHVFIKKVGFIVVIIMSLSSLLTFNFTNLLAMLLLLLFSYFYSAPPLRLKEVPILDSFSNVIIYAFGPGLLGFSFGGTLFETPAKGYLLMLGVLVLHSYSTIMDYSTDKKVGHKTFAVAFGKKTTAVICLLVFFLIFLVGNFRVNIIDYFLLFCSIFFLVTIANPKEKVATTSLLLMFLGFIVFTLIFLIKGYPIA